MPEPPLPPFVATISEPPPPPPPKLDAEFPPLQEEPPLPKLPLRFVALTSACEALPPL